MSSIGSYYITVMPDMSQFKGKLIQGLNSVGVDGGKSFGSSFISGLKNTAIGVAVGNLISQGVNAVANGVSTGAERLDIINNFPKVMQNLGFSAEDATENINEVQDALMGLPTSLQDGVQAVQRLTSATGDLDYATDLFIAFNNALVSGAAPASLQASALEQFQQAVAKGKPDMLEWRSMMNAMPAQLTQIAVSMGLTASELGEGLRQGTIPMEDFYDALLKLNKEGTGEFASFEDQVGTVTHTIGTAMTNMQNRIGAAWADILGAIGQEEIYQAIESVSHALLDLGESVGAFITKLKSSKSLQKSLQTIGEHLQNLFEKIASWDWEGFGNTIMSVLETVFGFIADHGEIVIGVLTAITATTVAMNMGQIIEDVQKLGEGIQAVWTLFTTNPIALVVVGIAAAAAAFATWVLTTEEGQKTWQDICDWFTTNVWPILQAIGNYFTNTLGPIFQWFATVIVASVVTEFQKFCDWCNTNVLPILQAIGDFISNTVVPAVVSFADAVGQTLGPILEDLGKWIGDRVKDLSGFVNTVRKVFNDIGKFMEDPIGNAAKAIGDAINNIKNWFTGLISSIKMPHLSVTGSLNPLDWFSQGLPNISIAWYATGGIVDGATLIGAGERGAELIWPSYEPYMSKYAAAIAKNMDGGGTTYNVYINGTKVSAQYVMDVVDELVTEVQRYSGMNLGGAYAY